MGTKLREDLSNQIKPQPCQLALICTTLYTVLPIIWTYHYHALLHCIFVCRLYHNSRLMLSTKNLHFKLI